MQLNKNALRLGFIVLQRPEFLVQNLSIHTVTFQILQKFVILQPVASVAVLV